MPVRETEAIILRSYPLKEADKIVSFLSRSGGKTRGVAPNARRSVKRFGAGLELLSHVRLRYTERESQDLVDMYFSPGVHRYGMLDWAQFDRIVQAGYDYARTELDRDGFATAGLGHPPHAWHGGHPSAAPVLSAASPAA